jgi:hypothetical protein
MRFLSTLNSNSDYVDLVASKALPRSKRSYHSVKDTATYGETLEPAFSNIKDFTKFKRQRMIKQELNNKESK